MDNVSSFWARANEKNQYLFSQSTSMSVHKNIFLLKKNTKSCDRNIRAHCIRCL